MKVIANLASVTGIAAIASVIAVNSAIADASRSVSLVLDASGSMNAKLSDGQSRLAAAKSAVADLVDKMDGSTRLALRAYGHLSARSEHNCKDTALLVGFDSVSANKGTVAAEAHRIEARGYTPITYALTLAAQDIA
jgi:Ca-activated chloride channel family protein